MFCHTVQPDWSLDHSKILFFYSLKVKKVESLVLTAFLISLPTVLSTGIPTFTNPAADVTGPAERFWTHEATGAASTCPLDWLSPLPLILVEETPAGQPLAW